MVGEGSAAVVTEGWVRVVKGWVRQANGCVRVRVVVARVVRWLGQVCFISLGFARGFVYRVRK